MAHENSVCSSGEVMCTIKLNEGELAPERVRVRRQLRALEQHGADPVCHTISTYS